MVNTAQYIEQIKVGKVDPFRNNFDSLTFAEVSQIYEAVTPHFGVQRHFGFEQFKRAAKSVKLSGVVVELGDHDGNLAEMTLQDFPDISEWIGFDVCAAGDRLEHPRYKHKMLTDWFHKSAQLNEVDVFVSTHTLEHMGRLSALDTLRFVSESPIKKMILEMPFRHSGNWNGSSSLHIFKGSPREISNILKHAGWEIVYRNVTGMNHTWGAVR